MFDFLFGSAQAYQQVGLFFGALVCFGLGALLLGSSIYWQLRGLRVTGSIIGVVDKGGTYAPVYRYTSADGSAHQAISTISSGTVAGKETGRVVPLLVSPHDPGRAQEAGIGSAEIVFVAAGLLLVMAGIWMGSTAITAYPVTAKTWIMAALLTVYGFWHLRRGTGLGSQRPSMLEAGRSLLGNRTAFGAADVKPIEQLVPPADARKAADKTSQQWSKAAPFALFFALLLMCLAVHQATALVRLQSTGLRTEGQVVSLKAESSSGGSYSYFPIIRYRARSHVAVEFKDNIGSNPPRYRVGDKVTVLYLPDSSRPQAIIDRGPFWNWVIPAALGAAALVALWLFFFLRRAVPQATAKGVGPSPMSITS
jgi:hypothetical protein